MSIPVLMYHSLVENSKEQVHRTILKVEHFEEQMTWLHKKGYTTISIAEAIGLFKKNKSIFKKVIISFDDGYVSMVKHALPILEKYNFQATLFLITSSVNKSEFPDGIAVHPKDRPLQLNELKTLQRAGWEIASHGVSHHNHATLTKKQLAQEYKPSLQFLQSHLNIKADSYAFPYGSYSKSAVEILPQYYQAGFAIHGGHWQKKSDIRRIPRIEINCFDTIESFQHKVYFGYGTKQKKHIGIVKNEIISRLSLYNFLKNIISISNRTKY